MTNEDPGRELPDVLFVYARKGSRVHLEQRGVSNDELIMLVLAWWLQLDATDRQSFAAMLGRILLGTEEPSPIALGIATMVRRSRSSPPSVNGQE